MDWSDLFAVNVSPLELVARATLMYWFLFLAFRFVLRRDAGSVGIADILLVVLIADASQNAMAGDYTTLTEGAIVVATLMAWNVALDWASWRFAAMRRFVEPAPLLLMRDGRFLPRNMRREFVTREELESELRKNGIVAVADVRRAYMESDGSFSIIRAGSGTAASPPPPPPPTTRRKTPGA